MNTINMGTDASNSYPVINDNLKRIEDLSEDATDCETITSSEVLYEQGQEFENGPNFKDNSCSKDLTIVAGNRLYSQAVDQYKRHEEQRKAEWKTRKSLQLATQSEIGLKLRALVHKKNQDLLRNRPPKTDSEKVVESRRLILDIETLKSAPVPERCNRLYSLSNNKQMLGKQRRSLIEENKAKANCTPETKILPVSQAGDMYERSKKRLTAHKLKLAALAKEIGSQRYHENPIDL